MNCSKKQYTYIIVVVSFWNQPIGVIMALPKIAEMGKEEYPSAVDIIINNTNVDNLVGRKRTMEETLDLARDVEHILEKVVLL